MKPVNADISALIGQKLQSVSEILVGTGRIHFVTTSGQEFHMFHEQDCCEVVDVQATAGSVVLNAEILAAYETDDHGTLLNEILYNYGYSYTFTHYVIVFALTTLHILWVGRSNGYYSEEVTFQRTK